VKKTRHPPVVLTFGAGKVHLRYTASIDRLELRIVPRSKLRPGDRPRSFGHPDVVINRFAGLANLVLAHRLIGQSDYVALAAGEDES
jgi:hypothetical protein